MYETILVASDGSENATEALGHAVDLAAAVAATVHVMTVVETGSNPLKFGVSEVDELNQAAKEIVDDILEEQAHIDTKAEIRRGKPTESLLEYADEIEADLIVVGQSGADAIEAAVFGSTTDRLARETDIPLTIVPLSSD